MLVNATSQGESNWDKLVRYFMNKFYYVYVLLSEKDRKFYIGYTDDLKKRLSEHNSSRVPSTKNRTPLKLVYYEACLNQQDAMKREGRLKTTWGGRYIKSRLAKYLGHDL